MSSTESELWFFLGTCSEPTGCRGCPVCINITRASCKEGMYAFSRNVISFVVPTHIKKTYTFVLLFVHKSLQNEVSFNCLHLPCVLKIVTFLHVLIHYIHNHVFFCVMSLLILTKRLFDSDIDCSSCYWDITTFRGESVKGGAHKKLQLSSAFCHEHVHRPLIRGCKVLTCPHWGNISADWSGYLWHHKCYKRARSCVQHTERV